MTDITLRFESRIDAPVRPVFEACRDPRSLYADDPTHDVVACTTTPEATGTTALIRAREGLFIEDIDLDYVEVVPDERIVFEARPNATLRRVNRIKIPGALHVWTWTFTPQAEGTRLTLVVVEKDAPRWERLMDTVFRGMPTRMFSKEVEGRLSRLKTRVEQQTRSAH